MSAPKPPSPVRVVLEEDPKIAGLDASTRYELLRTLLEAGTAVTRAVPGGWRPPSSGRDLIVGRFAESPEGPSTLQNEAHLNVAGVAPSDVLSLVQDRVRSDTPPPSAPWKPWFPVIDYDRCTNCLQCLTFCLFDVYGVDPKNHIQVQHEHHCKTDCPACSRVCPEAAIMFPKYKSGPINGDRVREEDLQREAMKVDISALLGGDIYGALRTRSDGARKRFSTERDESKALLERKRCLKKLQSTLDIPDEVLMTLPSAGDIEERARRAKEKAARREERSRTLKDQRPVTEDDWGI